MQFRQKLKDTIKRILPPGVKNIAKDILFLVRVKRRLRPFLSPGIYRVRIMSFSKRALAVVPRLLIKIGNPYKGAASETVRSGIKQLVCYFANKLVFLTDNRAITLYINTDTGRDILWRMEKYVGNVAYPRSEFLEISVTGRYTVAERVIGEPCLDKRRALYLAEELLGFAAQAQEMPRPEKYGHLDCTDYSDIRYHVQHGDAQYYNVLWQDETHYKFIDFDMIDVYPAFYDFFYIILSEEGRGLEEFLNGYFDGKIADYMKSFGIKAPIEIYKDECMAAFLSVPGKFIPADQIACRVIPPKYKKTWLVLAAGKNREKSAKRN